jgi:hypothetical protein
MKRGFFLFSFLIIAISGCGYSQPMLIAAQISTDTLNTLISETAVSESTLEYKTLAAIPAFTPLPGPCSTAAPNELNDFIKRSLTIDDNGKILIIHVTSRFWIYLDDRIYPIQDLLNSMPEGLVGYISNGSIRGPQCYPIMFEAVREGKGLLHIKDFQLSIIVDNNMPESPLPLH